MNAIRIRTTITSETLHLPELRSLIGEEVEILVTEQPAAASADSRWADAARAARELADYDFDAWQQQREQARLRDQPLQSR